MYDYLIVGAGLFGAVFAHELTAAGKRCLVIDRRSHPAGNIYTQEVEGIQVHRYGAHVFHTADQEVWAYVNRLAAFNRFTNSPLVMSGHELYNLPFNMNTYHALWGVTTPQQARAKIAQQVAQSGITEPRNLEEQAIRLVGHDIYEKLIKGYTEKQWGRPADELPAAIIRRLPVRFTYDNNYYSDPYQGIPVGGYTQIVEKLLSGAELRLNTDFFVERAALEAMSKRTLFTGPIDRYYDYSDGELMYRSLRFETETLATDNYQGNAVVNYADGDVPYTRIIEHKHFEYGTQPVTVITREYPAAWQRDLEPYYPLNDAENAATLARYTQRAARDTRVRFGGRLGAYAYWDMDRTIAEALRAARAEIARG